MKSMTILGSVALAAALLAVVPARAEGDAAAGKKVFNKCTSCHDAVTDKNKIGPSLHGVVGRKAGSLESFQDKYSEAMKAAGAGGLVWDEANIAEYLKDPKAKVPDNKMAFAGLKKDEDIANVIAYLKADPKP
jgi:cytochrome c